LLLAKNPSLKPRQKQFDEGRNRPQAHLCFLRDAPEGGLLSSKPPEGASALLDEPFGVRGRAGDKAGAKLNHRRGIRLANASEPPGPS
jgi:hypothetical protein